MIFDLVLLVIISILIYEVRKLNKGFNFLGNSVSDILEDVRDYPETQAEVSRIRAVLRKKQIG